MTARSAGSGSGDAPFLIRYFCTSCKTIAAARPPNPSKFQCQLTEHKLPSQSKCHPSYIYIYIIDRVRKILRLQRCISVYQCKCISAVYQMYISKRLYNTLYLLQSSQYCRPAQAMLLADLILEPN